MIQFTSVTLLYSFASSLGDFQVCISRRILSAFLTDTCDVVPIHRSLHHHTDRGHKSVNVIDHLILDSDGDSSGTNTTIPTHLPQATDGQSGIKKGADQHYRSNCHHRRYTILGVFLGATARMVRSVFQE
jgi:hypothetical protein